MVDPSSSASRRFANREGHNPDSSMSRRVPEETLLAQAKLLSNDAAMTAFKEAAFNDDLWREAEADPRSYFGSVGIDIPDILEMILQSHESLKPWPPTIPELQMVTLRCWWVWGKVDNDEEPVKPFRFCLEVPSILLQYLRR